METQEITQAQAVNLLVQAAELGQRRGTFSLREASMLELAIRTLYPNRTEAEEVEASEAGDDNE